MISVNVWKWLQTKSRMKIIALVLFQRQSITFWFGEDVLLEMSNQLCRLFLVINYHKRQVCIQHKGLKLLGFITLFYHYLLMEVANTLSTELHYITIFQKHFFHISLYLHKLIHMDIKHHLAFYWNLFFSSLANYNASNKALKFFNLINSLKSLMPCKQFRSRLVTRKVDGWIIDLVKMNSLPLC